MSSVCYMVSDVVVGLHNYRLLLDTCLDTWVAGA